jgi:hypothetical protein
VTALRTCWSSCVPGSAGGSCSSLRRSCPPLSGDALTAVIEQRDFLEAGNFEGGRPTAVTSLFRPVPALEPSLLSYDDGMIRRLALAAYEDRVFPGGTVDPGRLAALADALEESGCADVGLLSHLRLPGPHVRGGFLPWMPYGVSPEQEGRGGITAGQPALTPPGLPGANPPLLLPSAAPRSATRPAPGLPAGP